MSNVHVCLVSEQLIPNVLPVLREKPRSAVLLATVEMEARTVMLAEFFRARGVKTEVRKISPFDFSGVLEVCRQVIEDYQGNDLTLNVTGGTKVAALAAYQQFYFDDLRVIYLDTAHNSILELGNTPVYHEIVGNLLKVKDYLACYGKGYVQGTSGAPPDGEPSRRAKTAEVSRLFIRRPDLLLAVNRQVAQYKDDRRKPYFSLIPARLPDGGEQLCQFLRDAGVATLGIEGSANINTEEQLFYLHGGWLEEFVYGVIAELGVPSLDLRMNVEIEWLSAGRAPTRNELDIAFTHRNRLHIISCKASTLDQRESGAKGKEALYELDSLADNVGGLFARPMLVSAHQLGSASRQRANDLGIDIVSGMEVLGLGKYLRQKWFS